MAKRKSQRRKSHKIYKMKGCSKTCKNKKKYLGGNNIRNAYPSSGAKFNGFNFLNPTSQLQRGGNSSSFVGNSWSPSPSNWPGVNGGTANHLSLNTYNPGTDIQLSMKPRPFSVGGNKKTKQKKQKGGSFSSNSLLQDFVNLGRNVQYGMGSVYNSANGYKQPVNPNVFKDQLQNHKMK